jgi:hypothetical protein
MIATQGMWELLSDLLEGEKLPDSLNETLYGLRDGTLMVVPVNELSDDEITKVLTKIPPSIHWQYDFAHAIEAKVRGEK